MASNFRKMNKKPASENIVSSSQVSQTKKAPAWVSSAFDEFSDFDEFDAVLSEPEPQNLSKSSYTQQKLNYVQSDSRNTNQNNSANRKRPRESDHATVGSHSFRRKGVSNVDLWAEKHSPKLLDELAVHKKKIQEVEAWLKGALSSLDKTQILLLTGPAGCGKTATIKTLAHELKCEIQEWQNPIQDTYQYREAGTELSFSERSRVEGPQYQSQTVQFKDFVVRANKYNTLPIFGNSSDSCKKLILVEEFPNIFLRDPGSFHVILRQYSRCGHCPLVFIVSDSVSGDSNERLLFPQHISQEVLMDTISFNPVAMTSLTKVISRVAAMETSQGAHKFQIPSKSVLESIAMSSAGDVRGAINALQFACLKDTTDLSFEMQKPAITKKSTSRSGKTGRRSGKKKGDNAEESELAAIGGRDTSLFLFRALGKILYCKRDDPTEYPDHPRLPPHLSEFDRDPLLLDPEDVIERCHLSGEYFTAYLHQNYLDFYSDIDDIVRASAYLSDADHITVDWASRSILQSYAASVATRGLIHSNSQRSTAAAAKSSNLGWKPLHKPQWYTSQKEMRKNKSDIQDLFRDYRQEPEVLYTEILPYISLVNIPLKTAGQASLIQRVCMFSSKSFVRNFPEKLSETDVGGLGSQMPLNDDIPLSQSSQKETSSQPTAVEDEEIEIDEFEDD